MAITATPKAVAEVKRLATKRTTEGKTPQGLRIGIRGGGCTGFAYLFEWADTPPRDSDKVFEFDGLKVVVDPKSLVFLNGTTLDYEVKLMQHGFKFVNPNEATGCGCGESFGV